MAKIENTTPGPRVLHSLPKADRPPVPYAVPAAKISEDGKQTKTNGTAEIPDDVLDELLAKDAWTKGLFADGDLVRVAKSPAKTKDEKADPPAK